MASCGGSHGIHHSIIDAKMIEMRTTIDIPEALLRRAKAEAALRGLRLKDIVRDALQHLLQDTARSLEPADRATLEKQELAEDCVFPLIIGTTGSVMRDLRGDKAQRLLDDADIEREVHPR